MMGLNGKVETDTWAILRFTLLFPRSRWQDSPSTVNELVIEAGKTERHYWADLWRYRELFFFLSWRDILVRYKQIIIVFLLVGIWHGAGWNFVAFGAAQALGMVTAHYYTIFLKRKLDRDGFKAYNENAWIRAVAVSVTFCYFAMSLVFFACTFEQIAQMFRVLRH